MFCPERILVFPRAPSMPFKVYSIAQVAERRACAPQMSQVYGLRVYE